MMIACKSDELFAFFYMPTQHGRTIAMTGEHGYETVNYCLQRRITCPVIDFCGFRSLILGVASIGKSHPDY